MFMLWGAQSDKYYVVLEDLDIHTYIHIYIGSIVQWINMQSNSDGFPFNCSTSEPTQQAQEWIKGLLISLCDLHSRVYPTAHTAFRRR